MPTIERALDPSLTVVTPTGELSYDYVLSHVKLFLQHRMCIRVLSFEPAPGCDNKILYSLHMKDPVCGIDNVVHSVGTVGASGKLVRVEPHADSGLVYSKLLSKNS